MFYVIAKRSMVKTYMKIAVLQSFMKYKNNNILVTRYTSAFNDFNCFNCIYIIIIIIIIIIMVHTHADTS